MCGIAGFVHNVGARPADSSVLKTMTDSIRHRGPDAEGFFIMDNVALGNRRLSVIDLETGSQPKYNDDGSVAIVYNGEIYNYVELREELKTLGHRFKTKSDTEVIIRAYEQWGADCQKKLNGMWAFALWDTRRRRLFCSRDRLGEKPFFYTFHNGTFVFGSEIKALFAFGVPRILNREMLDAYLCFAFVQAPYTMFQNIHKLPAGHFIELTDGKVAVAPYWNVHFPAEEDSRHDERNILEEFEHLFFDAVRIRIRSDVPFGAFLSGGLDSSSVVAAMSRCASAPVKTCTIGFENKEYDERRLARLVAEKFKTDHTERIVLPDDARSLMDKLAWHYDEPFGDPSALPTFVLSRIARERVTVALTGDGGDEVLSGYTVHQGERFCEHYAHVPGFVRRQLVPWSLNALQSVTMGRLQRAVHRAGRVVHTANLPFIDRMEARQSGFSPSERASMIMSRQGVRPAREFIEEAISPVSEADNFTKLNYWLLKVGLPDDMLCKVDRAAMAHSLETRVPFLDHRLVELMASVSMQVKLHGYTRKYVLRKTLGRVLPPPVLSAPKRGFNVPLRDWLMNGADTVLEERAHRCASAAIVNQASVTSIVNDCRSTGRSPANALWALAMLSYALDGQATRP